MNKRKQTQRQAVNVSDTNPKKPLVLFYYDKPSWSLVICTMLLFLVALFCLDHLFGMDDSAFPSWEAGYYLEADRDPVFNVKEDVRTEFVEAGSWASIYRGLLPVVIIIYFSFAVGYGSVGCRSREVWFFSCLACLCIISYCLAWIVPPKPTILLIARIVLFVFAGLSLLLSLCAQSLFRYTKYNTNEQLLPLVLSTYPKGSDTTDADCGVL